MGQERKVTETVKAIKTVAHEDDMYVLVKDVDEMESSKEVIKEYRRASGANDKRL